MRKASPLAFAAKASLHEVLSKCDTSSTLALSSRPAQAQTTYGGWRSVLQAMSFDAT